MSYQIPPRLNNTDYQKYAITQDELLQIAIANDANIAAARKAAKSGMVPSLTKEQSATTDEILQDESRQEGLGRMNLISLGFKDREASLIVAQLLNEPDVLRAMNLNFPAISKDIKQRINIKLLTPTYFLTYLREYVQTLAASRGLDVNSSAAIRQSVNAFVNSVNELKRVLPRREDYDVLIQALGGRIQPQRLEMLQAQREMIPTEEDYRRLEQEDPAERFSDMQQILQNTSSMPSREQVQRVVQQISRERGEEITAQAEVTFSRVLAQLENQSPSRKQRADQQDLLTELRREIPTPTASAPMPMQAEEQFTATAFQPSKAPNVVEVGQPDIGEVLTTYPSGQPKRVYVGKLNLEEEEKEPLPLFRAPVSEEQMMKTLQEEELQVAQPEQIEDPLRLILMEITAKPNILPSLISDKNAVKLVRNYINDQIKKDKRLADDVRQTFGRTTLMFNDQVNTDLPLSTTRQIAEFLRKKMFTIDADIEFRKKYRLTPQQLAIYKKNRQQILALISDFLQKAKDGTRLSAYIATNREIQNKPELLNVFSQMAEIYERELLAKKKSGNGLRKIRIGGGIAVKEKAPTYAEFGKYIIHMPKLTDQDILHVKYKSNGPIPKFKPVAISDILRDFITDLLQYKKANPRIYQQIDEKERQLFEDIAVGAGLWSGLGLPKTTISADEQDRQRFEILRGEYYAGNNSPKLMQELRRLVVKFMSERKITKNEGYNLLNELS